MTCFKSALSRLSHKSTPVVTANMDLHSWYHHLPGPFGSSEIVEICTALVAGDDAWGTRVDENHHHTLLRVSLVPTRSDSGASADVFLIEYVLSTGGVHHSVTPIGETFSTGGNPLPTIVSEP